MPKEKYKKLIWLIKDEFGEKIGIEFVGLRAKNCCYLIRDSSEDKKSKRHRKIVSKKNNLSLKIIKTV